MSKERTVEKKVDVRNSVGRVIFAFIAIFIQFAWVFLISFFLGDVNRYIAMGITVLSVVFAVYIYGENKTSAMKTPWIFLILLIPIAGIIFYLFVGLNGTTKRMRARYRAMDDQIMPLLPEDTDVRNSLKRDLPQFAGLSRYLSMYVRYPLYRNTAVDYFHDAKDAVDAQIADISKAEHFIFMEYHAIEDAETWHRVRDVLAERAAAGVEVRLFYDDMGSIGFINTDFIERTEKLGIRCRVFNPVEPFLNLFLNNRDHRKVTVIDGRIGYTGGYNLANEYVGLTHPYGFWKDTGVRLEGEGVKSLTAMFLEMWNAMPKAKQEDFDFAPYLPETDASSETGGYVQPYADNPTDRLRVGEDVYLSMIAAARNRIWIMTPYLIITDEMNRALGMAARRGVDVRIITPGIPDKKLIYAVTRSYYPGLVSQGVKIFEFTPGFCHAKMCLVDDDVAACGTINFDYRSLYHHFENGCLLYGMPAVADIRDDFEKTFEECQEVTGAYATKGRFLTRFWQCLLRLISGLL